MPCYSSLSSLEEQYEVTFCNVACFCLAYHNENKDYETEIVQYSQTFIEPIGLAFHEVSLVVGFDSSQTQNQIVSRPYRIRLEN